MVWVRQQAPPVAAHGSFGYRGMMQTDFYGLPAHTLTNGHLTIDVLTSAGPRVVRLALADQGENLLAEMPTKSWETPYGTFFIRGGHRLWHAPEQFPRTYQPDNDGLSFELTPNGARLSRPPEPATGIAKTLRLTLHPDRAAVTVEHGLTNAGSWPITLAPWAITQLRSGGLAILPLGAAEPPANTLLPDRPIVAWPYTRLTDPRLQIFDDYLLVHARADLPPAKIGTFGRRGWAGYLLGGTLLVKRFTPQPDLPHPDMGCNLECYYDQHNLELETLAPLTSLEPGETASHTEIWELHGGLDVAPTIEGVRELASLLSL